MMLALKANSNVGADFSAILPKLDKWFQSSLVICYKRAPQTPTSAATHRFLQWSNKMLKLLSVHTTFTLAMIATISERSKQQRCWSTCIVSPYPHQSLGIGILAPMKNFAKLICTFTCSLWSHPNISSCAGLQNPVIVNDFGCVKRLIIRCVVLTMHDDLMTVSSVIWLNHFGFQCAPNLVVGNV